MTENSLGVNPFRKLIDSVEFTSEFIVAVILDIRGFSSFAMKVESAQTTAFLKRVYKEMIDRFFSSALFIKPMGDGLLIAFPYTEATVKQVATTVINSCMNCVTEFAILTQEDEMINFPTPDKIGIGICRGAATRVTSNGMIIDYSGRPFNIASRLMDLARPGGIVIDESFKSTLIPSDVIDKFATASVYLKGISDNQLIRVYYTKDLTIIPSSLMQKPKTE